jgi:tRNA(Ile)-lysidine synthase
LQVIKTPDHACLDAAKVTFPLTIRTVQEGDRFVPFGMKGSKLVSDFLTDQKCTIFERRRQLVITDASDTIVWLVGRRPDQRFCISETTTQMLVCHYSDHQPTQPA